MALQRRSRVGAADRAREHGALAALVVARRQDLGLSQTELADLAGVSARFVHALETGATTVGLDRLLGVLEILGLHLQVGAGESDVVIAGDDLARRYGLGPAGEEVAGD